MVYFPAAMLDGLKILVVIDLYLYTYTAGFLTITLILETRNICIMSIVNLKICIFYVKELVI